MRQGQLIHLPAPRPHPTTLSFISVCHASLSTLLFLTYSHSLSVSLALPPPLPFFSLSASFIFFHFALGCRHLRPHTASTSSPSAVPCSLICTRTHTLFNRCSCQIEMRLKCSYINICLHTHTHTLTPSLTHIHEDLLWPSLFFFSLCSRWSNKPFHCSNIGHAYCPHSDNLNIPQVSLSLILIRLLLPSCCFDDTHSSLHHTTTVSR